MSRYDDADGATPIDDDTAAGLRADWIATREELNQAEQENILAAVSWAYTRRRAWTVTELMTVPALKALHRRMFNDVWRWAGTFRRTDLNLGSAWWAVPVEVESLCSDVLAQTADPDAPAYPALELAVRFHHRLVAIHPFPNGNGRHARLSADLLVRALGGAALTWGARDLTDDDAGRRRYLDALRLADRTGDYAPLVEFATS